MLRILFPLLLMLPVTAHAKTICVFSLIGAQGELWELMTDYRIAATGWGEEIELRPFTNERVAAEDLKAGLCDGLMMTGIKARQFVPFTGSIDSIGGLHNYESLRVMIELAAHPQLAPSMRNGAWETAGILPLGAAYIFLKDRRITGVEDLAGKRMAVFDNDRAQVLMCERISVIPELSDVSNFSNKFNNNIVDLIAAPATAYMALELYRGVGARGMVVKLPVAQLTMQLVASRDKFDDAFLDQSRRFLADRYDDAMRIVHAAEDEILFFYPPPDKDRSHYEQMMNESRAYLVDSGVYHEDTMRWLKKARCKVSPERSECSNGQPW